MHFTTLVILIVKSGTESYFLLNGYSYYVIVVLGSQSGTVSGIDDSPQGAGGALSKRLRMYKCERCNTQYMGLAMLRQHCRDVHGDQKYYKCHVCGKLFSHPSSRNIHLRLHSGEKPYKCTTCGKQFRVSSHLKDHVRVHTGELDFHWLGTVANGW